MSAGERLLDVPLAKLERDNNIRDVPEDAALRELAESIKEHGILEPVIVRGGKDGRYSLISGFRRCAAAKLARLLVVPAVLRGDEKTGWSLNEVHELQLVENLQRQDLSPLDEARAFQAILQSGVTQKELAQKVGKSQPYVANRIRLLQLPEAALDLVQKGRMTAAAAESILTLPAGADRERNRLAKKAGEYAKGRAKPVGERELEFDLRQATFGYQHRSERERAVALAKFPNCPVKDCGKKGTRIPYDASHSGGGAVSKLSCSRGHEWSTTTGKVETRRDYYSGERVPPKPAAPPTLPVVSEIVGKTPSVARIGARILEALVDVSEIEISWANDGELGVNLYARAPRLSQHKVPSFGAGGNFRGKDAVRLEELGPQRDDKERKEAAATRARLEAWLATFGKPGRKAGNSAPNKEAPE